MIVSIAFQPAGITGFILLATRRRDLPPGSLSAIFVVNTVLLTKQESTFPFIFVGVGTGVVADALMWRMKPREGVGWPLELWSGPIILSGFVGLLLSYVLLPPEGFAGQRK